KPKRSATSQRTLDFAGAAVDPIERTASGGARRVPLTPREVQLIELLVDAAGEVVSYETLYHEILGRKFVGDTSNMRVLLGKLDLSFRAMDISIRRYIDVIPKTGYRYRGGAE